MNYSFINLICRQHLQHHQDHHLSFLKKRKRDKINFVVKIKFLNPLDDCGIESISCLNDKSLPKSVHPTFLLSHRWDKQGETKCKSENTKK